MHASSFPCPHCSAALRIRSRTLIGRRVKCPDCGQPLEIVADGPKALAARKFGGEEPAKARGRSGWLVWLATPAGIGWVAAAVLVLAILVVANPFSGASIPGRNVKRTAEPSVPQPSGAGQAGEIADDPAVQGPDARLTALGTRLSEYHERHGHFPPGTAGAGNMPVSERFSWLAQLAAQSGSGKGQPWWDQPWHDPVNDRFVRRRLPEFQNPAIEQTTGQNRYPATHFVGMAGVGADAPELPAGHPRAGIFGYGRRTKLDDVRDGAANTIAVAGANSELGSWAAAGRATVRPLTREPYVNGPDGLGTGQADGMFVLMADGSVRFLSRETSPVIMRRMAAMADGLPLDPSVPGEPGEAAPAAVAQANDPPRNVRDPDDVPLDVPVAPEPPVVAPAAPKVVDVAGALSQKIVRFEQSQAAPFAEILLLLEEMAGVPIRYDERIVDEGAQVSVKVEDTTVGGILEKVLERVQLAYTIERDGIRLRRAEPTQE